MRRRGFTFIELITVWAIIAILAAILFPVFAKAREKARQCSCLSNLGNAATALRLYAYDHYGHLPPTANDLQPLVPRYLADGTVLCCLSMRGTRLFDYPPPLPRELMEARTASDYVYRGGLCDDDSPLELVAADLFDDLHNGGANYLFVDGHARWLAQAMAEHALPPGKAPEAQPGPNMVGMEALQELRKARAGRAYLKPYDPPPALSMPPPPPPGSSTK